MKFRPIPFRQPRGAVIVLPLGVLVACVSVVVIVGVAWYARTKIAQSAFSILQTMVAFGAAAFMTLCAFEWIRGWYAYSTTYVVSDTGVTIESRGGSQHVSWAEFTHGFEKRLQCVVLLYSPHLSRPVVFLNNTLKGGMSSELQRVRTVVRRKLGNKLVRTWL